MNDTTKNAKNHTYRVEFTRRNRLTGTCLVMARTPEEAAAKMGRPNAKNTHQAEAVKGRLEYRPIAK